MAIPISKRTNWHRPDSKHCPSPISLSHWELATKGAFNRRWGRWKLLGDLLGKKKKKFILMLSEQPCLLNSLPVFTVPVLSKRPTSAITEKLSPLENYLKLFIFSLTEKTVVSQEQNVSKELCQQAKLLLFFAIKRCKRNGSFLAQTSFASTHSKFSTINNIQLLGNN